MYFENRPWATIPVLILTVLTVLATGSAARADEAQNDIARSILESKVDRLFAPWDRPGSPGAAVVVTRGSEIIYRRGYGYAQLEYDIPITPTTAFHIASISKQFTAFAVTLLAAEGKLSLDDDIRQHIPEIADFGKTITLRHLIHHTSGLRDQWELLMLGGWRQDDVITHDHIMGMVRHQRRLNFDPGDEYLYCNTGYTLLAEIVHRVSGKTLRQWSEENIFAPLGMTSTHFHDDHEMIVKNRAYSYYPEGDGLKKSVLSYANVGATSLFTTVEDLAKWVHNYKTGLVGGSETSARMHEEGKLNNGDAIGYASGLSLDEYRGLRTVGHGGADAGFRTAIERFPDQDFAVIVFSNLATFNPGAMARRIADIYLAADFPTEDTEEAPEKAPASPVDPNLFDVYAGSYLFDNGTVMVLARDGDHLFRQIEGRPDVELLPRSATEFVYANQDLTIYFERDDQGKPVKIDYRALGLEALPFEPWEPGADELADLAGVYTSEEVGATYEVAVKDGGLTVRHRRTGELALTPTVRDNFTSTSGQLRFVREEGRATALLMTTGRVRDLLFERRSEVLTARVFIAASYDAVWERFTRAEAYADWFSSPARELGTNPGDDVTWGDEERVVYRGKLLRLEKGRGLAHTFQFVGFGFEEPPTRVEVEILEQGETVLVAISHDTTGAPRTAEMISPVGWAKSLSRLKTLLETGRPMPWPGE